MRRFVLTITALLVITGGMTALPGPAEAAFPGGIGRIAFVSDMDTTPYEVYVRDFSGSAPIRLTSDTNSDYAPRWSPDGTELVYMSFRSGYWQIVKAHVDGSGETQLTSNPYNSMFPSWTSQGDEILFSESFGGNRDVHLMEADGSNVVRLTQDPGEDDSPVDSPNGILIAFERQTGANRDIWTMDHAGSDQQRLTTHSAWDAYPSWSSDGSKIAFESDRDGDSEIFVMDADGSNLTQLTHNTSHDGIPAWSPDGTKIAFESDRDGDYDIWMMDPDGSNQAHLTDNPASEQTVDWEPVNRAPVAVDDDYQLPFGGSYTNTVTTNDFDPDGDALAGTLLTHPTHGTVLMDAVGNFVYDHGGTGTATSDSFTYMVSDGDLTSNAATVSLTIIPALSLDPVIVGGTGVISTSLEMSVESITGSDATRYAGADRYATAAALSAATFTVGAPAFIAVGDNFPDALAGGVAAYQAGGPILLVTNHMVPAATAAELSRLKPTEIVVLGGAGVISDAVINALHAFTTGSVSRFAGADRYATAAEVSRQTFPTGTAIAFLAVGDNFPDALAGGVVAALNNGPILLTRTSTVPTATMQELVRLSPTEVVILGGEGVIAPTVIDELVNLLPGVATVRISGSDRYGTAAAVSLFEFPGQRAGPFYLAVGTDFPDALAAVPVAAKAGCPILLVTTDSLPSATLTEILRLMP